MRHALSLLRHGTDNLWRYVHILNENIEILRHLNVCWNQLKLSLWDLNILKSIKISTGTKIVKNVLLQKYILSNS